MTPESIHGLWLRCKAFFRRRRLDRELDAELQFHLDQRAADLIAQGLAPAEARRQARIEFGGVERIKEECRESRAAYFLGTLLQDVRYALRTLRKSPGFTIVAILTLALGIGANTAIFSIIETTLLRPLPYAHSSRLVNVWTRFGALYGPLSLPEIREIRKESRSLEHPAVWTYAQAALTGQGTPQELSAARVSAGFFPLLGVRPLHGRAFLPAEMRPGHDHVVVLGAALWRKRFAADPHVIGRRIQLNRAAYTIVGVMPRRFRLPARTQLWMPFVPTPAAQASRAGRLHYVVARLAPGRTIRQAQAELSAIAARLARTFPRTDAGTGFTVRPLRVYLVGDAQAPLFLLFGAVGLVLLVACANLGNLQLARGWSRRHELAVRSALGASRGRLMRQTLVESLLLALVGGSAGLLLAAGTMAALRPWAALYTSRVGNAKLDAPVLWFTLAATLAAAIAFGFLPALLVTRSAPAEAMRGAPAGHRAESAGARQNRLRRLLVVAEVALAFVLVAEALLTLRSFARLSAAPLGFHPESVLTMQLALPTYQFKTTAGYAVYSDRILRRVRAMPGVESAAISDDIPFGRRRGAVFFRIEGRTLPRNRQSRMAVYNAVTPDYFRTLGVPILAGRDFDAGDRAGSEPVAIVDRAFARRYFGPVSPVGRHISLGDGKPGHPLWERIVGEVGDVHDVSPPQNHTPFIYRPAAQQGRVPADMDLEVRTAAAPAALAGTIENRIWSIDRDQPIAHLAVMTQVVASAYAEPRSQSVLLSVFGALGLLLALVGIYGVISFFVARRTREIGIRIALGAQSGDVLRLVVGQGTGLVLAGVAIGVAASFAVARLMRGMLYGVSATDPLTIAAVAILLALTGLAACYIPARRATRIDPIATLRQE